MKALHTVTAILEAGTGLALLGAPSMVVMILLGSPLDSPASLALGRVTGTALLALGIACWFACGEGQNHVAMGLVIAMLVYNIAVAALLAFAGIGAGLVGIALWPAVVLHAVMAVWCVACLRSTQLAKKYGVSTG